MRESRATKGKWGENSSGHSIISDLTSYQFDVFHNVMVLLHVLRAILLGTSIITNPIVIIGIEQTAVLLISKKLYSCPTIWTLYFVSNCSFTQTAAYSMTSCALQVLVNFSTQFSKCNIVLPTRIMSYKPVLCHYLNDYRTTSSGF